MKTATRTSKPPVAAPSSPPSAEAPKPVSRRRVVQGLLDLFPAPSYLEIGVFRGETFTPARAASKTGVDPGFRFDAAALASATPGVTCHEMTSDRFFGAVADPRQPFDVIYIDGLHTFEQTLRDLINSINFLKPDGVIVIDDVVPSSYPASLPDRAESRRVRDALGLTSRDWMGDVYRLVFFIESFCQQFSFRTVSDNHGQLVMWRAPRAKVPERKVGEIAALSYGQIHLDRDAFRFAPFAAIVAEVKKHRAGGSRP